MPLVIDVLLAELLACFGYLEKYIYVNKNNGDGTFAPPYQIAVPSGMFGITAGDFDEDGNLDLATTTALGINTIFGNGDEDEGWRMGGYQPFAFNPEHNLLFTLMHEGGGQETFEDAGTEVGAFSTTTARRGYRLVLPEEEPGMSLQVTQDDEPLLIVAPDETTTMRVYDARTGRLLREIPEIGPGLIQNLGG